MEEIQPTIFRAYDIRGRYQKEIDQHVFYKIGLAAGTYVKHHLNGDRLTAGNDIRKTSDSLSSSFIAGVTAVGVNVESTGTSSFGQTLYYGCKNHHDLISYITASHLPAEWNGVKFYYGDGVGLPENELRKIRDITLNQQWKMESWEDCGTIHRENPQTIYKKFFQSHFQFTNNIRVAVDCGGGSMTLSAPDIFKEIGLNVIPVFCEPDPLFSVRPSDPKPENLTTLVETVKKTRCDFGVAFDGDGDRAVIIDEKGNILSADQTGIILGKYGLDQTQGGTIVVNVECSKTVEEQLRPLGFSIKYIQVGHTFLTLHAKREQAPLGIESSGHLIIPNYFLFDDALIIPLKIAEILDKNSLSLSALQQQIPLYPREKLEVTCDDTIKFDVISQLKQKYKEEYGEVNTLDGVRIDFDYGWVLIRASNTGPLIRLTVEAETSFQINELVKRFKDDIEHVINRFSSSLIRN
jgi:phosphomannomutase